MSSGFVTESEVAEARRKRQEDWDRVRSADQPIDVPEEPFDHRSLFDRLQEQKQKKDLEYEEAHKLKNMIKGLDDDEIEFLDLVDRTKLAAERKKTLDEERELTDYRNRVASLQEKSLDIRLEAEKRIAKPTSVPSTRPSQVKLLKGVVVKKEMRKRKMSDSEKGDDDRNLDKAESSNDVIDKENCKESQVQKYKVEDDTEDVHRRGALTCIGILPGLGCYYNSSDSEMSSDFEGDASSPKVDMLGRKIIKKPKE